MFRATRRVRGFTLVEILVVVMIVAIVTSVAVLSLGIVGDDRELRDEGRRLASLIEVAMDESMLQGREYGIEFMVDAYRFVEFDTLSNRWGEIFGDETLRMRRLPEGAEFDLFVDDQRVELEFEPSRLQTDEDRNDEDRNDEGNEPADDVDNYAPHLLIFSSGDLTPFELHLYRDFDDQRVVIQGDFVGNIEFVHEEDWRR